MAEPDHASAAPSSTVTSTRDDSGASSSNFSQAPVVEEDTQQHHEFRHPEPENRQVGVSYRGTVSAVEESSTEIREDTWSCAIVLLTFWFFVSMTLILGIYGSSTLRLGRNTSLLLEPNPIFVQYIKVEELNESEQGPSLYGFYDSPPLDVTTTWSESHNISIAADSHQELIYVLNEGSQISISYSVNSPSFSVFLIIAEGSEDLSVWLEDPTYPNTTLSWNLVHGKGVIQQNIYNPSSYYVAVGNLNSEEVQVQLDIRVRATLYDTRDAYYRCTFSSGTCGFKVAFPTGSLALLTTPGVEQNTSSNEWYVRLSYGPRWATYILGIGGMTVLMLVAFNFLNKLPFMNQAVRGVQSREAAPERAPLLSRKDDDLLSWGSSYDSLSNDDDDLEDFMVGGSIEGKSVKEGDNSNNTRRLCAICFDAPRDCFFLPCGHSVACFECAIRIAEASGTCPLCSRNMKKVRKIFSV